MRKTAPYLVDLVLGLFIVGLVAWSYQKKVPSIEALSLKTYDLFTKWRKSPSNTDSIHIVEIDEESLSNLGRWPWPRSLVGQLLDEVAAAGAKVIGLNVFFTETDKNQGLEEIGQLSTSFADILNKVRPAMKRKRIPTADLENFLQDLEKAGEDLNGDAILRRSIEEAANVVLPMYFQPGDPRGNNLDPLPEAFAREKVGPAVKADRFHFQTGVAAVLPLDDFGVAAVAVGHSNLLPDVDGAVRRMAPLVRYGDSLFPSFALQIVRTYKDLQKNALSATANGLSLFKLNVPLDEEANTLLDFAGPAGTFKRHSAIDVLSGALPAGTLKNKIVLIGLTAPGMTQTPNFMTSTGDTLTGLEIWATHIENILNQRFITRPPWAVKAEWGLIALAALIVLVVLPFMRARFSIPIFFLVLAGMIGVSGFYFVQQAVWVSPAYGALLLSSGFLVMTGRRLMFTEKGKEMVEAEGLETNKMLGLSFQGQGMLDLAFEKFRKCPVDKSMKDLLYNLGLDMERKRQFSKAAAVYEHIAEQDPKYKDIQDKIEILKKAGEGAVFGSLGKKGSDATVVVEGLGQNATLGRYEVLKELGRGAMGIVYLGKDPKINRQVAIKTLRFEDNMDEDQTKSVKERFFREAESAGNLTHPNIVRIFDAGEDQDVAYIAMELLDGEDLKKYCAKDAMLPFARAIEVVIQTAFGLDYAHKQGVVHRDIKPGNIMLLKDGTLRITDFGIARIQASSRTATGAVLGTPAYMSPEQVNGKKVDGRADIFSLGVTLFELVTGEKPFYADSIAALLYRIANVDHPDAREFNSKLPPELIPIINKALAKDAANRYQTAGEMGTDLRQCLKSVMEHPEKSAAETAPPTAKPAGETPATNAPDVETKTDFAAELSEAFKIPGATETIPVSPPPKPKGGHDGTVVLPPDQTDALQGIADASKNGVPVIPEVDHGFQPETLQKKETDKKL